MKEKAIEKIVPIVPDFNTDKLYAASTQEVTVDGVLHLLIDFFRVDDQAAVLRTALTDKDYGNYEFGTESWNSRKMENGFYLNGYVESISNDRVEIDIEPIRRFTKNEHGWTNWMYLIEHHEQYIRFKKDGDARARRNKRLDERCKNMPEYPDGFEKWVEEHLFAGLNHIFYHKKGRYVHTFCTHCETEKTYVSKRREGIEGWAEPYLNPKNGGVCWCQNCGARGTFKADKNRKTKDFEKNCYVIQPYKEDGGVVVRYFQCIKRIGEHPEYMSITEIARTFFEPGKRNVQTDYHKHSYYSGENFWDDCNLYGMSNIVMYNAEIYPESWKALADSYLKYSALKEFKAKTHAILINPVNYLKAYVREPILEMVVKTGMMDLASSMVNGNTPTFDCSMKHPADIFKIYRHRIKDLQKVKGNVGYLMLYRMERECGLYFKDAEVKLLSAIGITYKKEKFCHALEYMTVKQFINRIEKYAGCEADCPCSKAAGHIRQVVDEYLDYLDMRRELGYDLNNSIYQYPRNLHEEHQKLILERDKGKLQKRVMEANEKYTNIQKDFKKWAKKYGYKKDEFIIRPAMNAGEIILEGNLLHHCVGGDHYLGKHNKGTSVILFLRRTDAPEIPYITIEIAGAKIIQWYGAYDKKTDREITEPFINGYLEKLNRKAG